jgi:PAS domain S-box-containing protein
MAGQARFDEFYSAVEGAAFNVLGLFLMQVTTVGQKKINILLVDDKPANLIALEAVVKQPGYNLILANSGEEAVSLLHIHQVALILLDVHMPGMDGYETARLIKAFPKFDRIPIIFMSAVYTEDEYVRKGYEAGGVDYFGKPFNTEALKLKVSIYAELYENNLALRNKEKDVDIREAELNAILESIPDPIYVVDASGLTRFNEAAMKLFGFDRPHELGQNFENLAKKMDMRYPSSGKPIPAQDMAFTHALKGENYSAQVLVRNRKTHDQKAIAVTAGPIFYEGKIIGAVVLNTDITSPA